MSLGKKLFHQDAAAAAGDPDATQGLVLHLDANDEDSIESGGANTGNGSGTWFDISTHDLNVPLVDKASDLKLHLNASDTSSYGGSGLVWTDLSGEGNNGAISNTSVSFQTDTRGYFDLDGTDDQITVTHDNALNPSTSDLTFEVWVQRGDTTNEQSILSKGGGASGYFLNYTTTSNVGYYFYDYGSTSYVRSGTSVSNGVGEWDHVVVTWDLSAKSFDMYVNGTLSNVTQQNNTGTPSSSTSDLLISTNDTTRGHPHWDGYISVVRIYATKFTGSEVAQNFRAGNFLSYSSIYSTNLQMDLRASNYTSGATLTDLQGNHNGTLTSDLQTSGNGFDKELGNYFNFTGATGTTTDKITVADNANIRSDQSFSIEMWVWRNDDGDASAISKGGNSSSSWDISFGASSGFGYQFNNYSGNANVKSGTGSFTSANRWEHIVATYDNSTRLPNFYIDGILRNNSQSAGSGTPADNTSDLIIGGKYEYPSRNGWDGKIGKIRFYKTVLTSAQVAQNYLATKNDYPNGYNATITGAELGDTSGSNPKFFNFNAKTEKIVINASTHSGALQPSLSRGMTYLIWIYYLGSTSTVGSYSSSADGSYIITGNSPSQGFYYRYYNSQLTLAIYDSSGTRQINQNFQSISNSVWYLVGFRVGVDGNARNHKITTGSSTFADASTGAPMSSFQTTNVNFNIGHYTTNMGFKGYIGAVQVYQRYFSDSEVTAYYDANKATYGLS